MARIVECDTCKSDIDLDVDECGKVIAACGDYFSPDEYRYYCESCLALFDE